MRREIKMFPMAAVAGLSLAAALGDSSGLQNSFLLPEGVAGPHYLPVVLEGQVTDVMGAGVAGAIVTLQARAGGSVDEGVVSARTNRQGEFVLRADPPIRGTAKVIVSLRGYPTIDSEVELTGDENDVPFFAGTMGGNLALLGRVKAKSGDFSGGAPVVRMRTYYRNWELETDGDGKFRIEEWSPGAGMLTVEAKGFGREVRRVLTRPREVDPGSGAVMDNGDLSAEYVTTLQRPDSQGLAGLAPPAPVEIAEGQEFEIELPLQRVVRLRIVDSADRAVAGAAVDVLESRTGDAVRLNADGEGVVVVEYIPLGERELRVRLSHPDSISSPGFGHRIDLSLAGELLEHRLVMQPAGIVAGVVVDSQTGKPLHGARVLAGDRLSDEGFREFTDLEGRFVIRGLPGGATPITVQRSEYAPQLEVVEVIPGQEATARIGLDPPRVLRGVVQNGAGRPAAGCVVRVSRWRGRQTLGLQTIADGQGRFALHDSPSDVVELTASMRSGEVAVQEVAAGSELISLTFTGEGRAESIVRVRVGQAPPEVSLASLDGAPISWKGKVTIVDFWATWCGPCVAALPQLQAVRDKLKGRKDYQLVGISLDDDVEVVKRFIQTRNMNWIHAAGPAAQEAADRWGVGAIPAIYVFDKEGRAVAVDIAAADLWEHVAPLLFAGDPAAGSKP